MRKTAKTLLIIACLVSFVVLLGVFNATKPRILVLHSAGPSSAWVQEVDLGMREALAANRRPVSVDWMYMDVSGPTTARGTESARAEARRAISREDPDVLIAVDDEANLLVARDYIGRERPRILYVSLDRPPGDYGYTGAPNVSGIAERLPFAAIRDAVTAAFPGRDPAISILGVDSVTGRAEMAQARNFDWGSVRVVADTLVSTADAWREFTAAADTEALVVLSCEDLPDNDGSIFTAAQAARWTQERAVPLPIGTAVDFVRDGGALGFSPPPDDYGQRAIGLALDWLDERSTPGPPPPVESAHFQVSIREGALAARGISLPPIYAEAARESGTLFN